MLRLKQHNLLTVLLLLVSYAYVLPRWADWSQNSRLDLVRALSERRSVVIDAYVANTGDYALYNGHFYSDKAPGPAFLALPAALVLRPVFEHPLVWRQVERLAESGALQTTLNPNGSGIDAEKLRTFMLQVVLSLLIVALPTALGALALRSLLQQAGLASGPATLVVLAYGLATAIAPYGGNFYSHALVASLLLGAWAIAARPCSVGHGILIGMLLGWAVISEYPAALPALTIGLAAVGGWRRPGALVWMTVGALPSLLLLALYNWHAFGAPLAIGYEHSALWQQQHHRGFLSITYPQPEAVWGLTFGSFRGLFVRAPWLLLALPGYVIWWQSDKARHHWWVAFLGPLSLLLFYGSSVMWWGGFAAGPRYLIPAIPFLAVASATTCARLWQHPWHRIALLALIAASLALTWAEAVARQGFPPDTSTNPWIGYTLPAWREGDIARNVGTALGLRGGLSLAPLGLLIAGAFAFSLRGFDRQALPVPSVQPPVIEEPGIAPIQH